MWRVLKRWWKYMAMKLHVRHEENADPKVQLEQAIQEAKEQHRRLTEQAANVIANQKSAQTRLERAMVEHTRADASARQAMLLADQAERAGDAEQAARLGETAEAFASRLLDMEHQVSELEAQLIQATSAAENAKAAVVQNASMLQRRLAEREQLLSTLDQAQMQEAMNKAVAQLTSTLGDDVPTLAEVRKKIDGRLARAQGMAELNDAHVGASLDARMLEVERAQMTADAQARLAQMRLEMGLRPQRVETELRVIEAPGNER